MVAIVAGNGLGLFNSSLNILGGAGVLGQSVLGQAGGRSFVNAATGNLILQMQDEYLSGRGSDLHHLRTYNSLGALNDGDGDGWRWGYEQTVRFQGPGTPTPPQTNAAVIRTDGDGHETTYTWNGSHYVSSEGSGAHDTLSYNSGTQEWVWTDGTSRVVETYSNSTAPNVTGRLKKRADASGNSITLTYDGSGRLTGAKDTATQQELKLTYAQFGGLTRLQKVETRALNDNGSSGELVKQVEYGYTNGRLTSVTTDLTPENSSDSKTYVTSYTYNLADRVESMTQNDGTSVFFTYHGDGKIATVKDSSSATSNQFAFSYGANETTITDGNGKVWTYRYHATTRQLTEILTPAIGGASLSTKFEYDANGNVTRIVDARGNAVVYEYDPNGNRILERDALGNTITRTFNTLNQVLTETRYKTPDPDGSGSAQPSGAVTTRYVYDSNSRLRFVVSAEGRVTESRYGSSGTVAAGLLTHTLTYTDSVYDVDELNQTAPLTETELNTWVTGLADKTKVQLTRFEYDLRGNLSKQTSYASVAENGVGVLDAGASVTEYVYDPHGQLLQTIAVRGVNRDQRTTLTSFGYDGLGRELTRITSSGTQNTVYDDANRKIVVTNVATSLVETRSYDTRGRLVSVSQTGDGATRETAKYVYNNADQLRMVEDAQGNRRYSFYDAAGRLEYSVDNTGAVSRLEYNATGQMTRQTRYFNRVAASDSSGWYDSTAKVVTKDTVTVGTDFATSTAHDRVTSYTYDDAGRLETMTDAGNTVTTTLYDGLSRVTMTQTGDRVTRFLYDKDSRRVGVVDALGHLTEYKYDAGGRLVETVRYTTRSPLAANMTAPVWIGVTNQIAVENQLFEYRVPAYDADGDALSYSVVSKPDWLTLDTSGGTPVLRGTPPAQLGNDSVTLRANDNRGKASDVTLTITVVNSTSSPGGPGGLTWQTLPPLDVVTSTTVSHVVPAASGAESLTYSVVGGLPPGLSFDPTTRTISGSSSAVGFYTIVLRVTDANGHSLDRTLSVQVRSTSVTASQAPGSDVLADWRPTNVDALRSYLYYDAQGRVVGSVDEQGFVTETILDEQAHTEKKLRYEGAVTVSSSDTLATLKDGAGTAQQVSLIQYDGFGRVSEVMALDGSTKTRNEYDNAGRLVRVVSAADTDEQRASRTFYNAFGNIVATLGGEGDAALGTSPTAQKISDTIRDYGLRYEHDSLGRVVRTIDANGHKTLFYYDRESRLSHTVRVIGQASNNTLAGEVSETVYNTFGQIESTRNYAARFSDADMDLLLVNGGGGSAHQIVSGSQTLLDKVAALANASLDQFASYTYDRRGLRLSETDGEGFVTRNAYTAHGELAAQVRTILNGKTTTTQFDYDLRGALLSQTSDVGGINFNRRSVYDAYGRVIQSIDAAGKITTTSYEDGGRAIVVSDPLNRTRRTEYDALGRLLKVYDGLQQLTEYTYNEAERSFTVKTPEGVEVKTTRTRHGETFTVEDGRGNTTTYAYNKNGQLKTITDEIGQVLTDNDYDKSGRLFETKDARGTVTRFNYDHLNRVLERRVDPSGLNLRTLYEFNALGRQIKVTEGANSSAVRITGYGYDRNGRLTQTIVDPASGALRLSTSYEYDALGNTVKVARGTATDPNQHVTLYAFDSLGRRVKEIRAPSSVFGAGVSDTRDLTTQYRYDAAGRVSRRIDATGQSTWYVYDAAGQQTHVVSAVGGVSESKYDANGRLIYSRAYVNALSASTVAGFGDVVSTLTPPAVNENDPRSYVVYDNDGRARFKLNSSSGSNWTIGESRYDANGNVIESRRYDKFVVDTWVSDNDTEGSPGISQDEMTAKLIALGYDDNAPNTLTNVQRARFAYDVNNRLRFTVDPLGSISERTYDAIGNVVSTVRFAARPTNLTSYTEGEINSAVASLRGNTNNQVTRFAYDKNNRLRFTVDALGSVSESTYDALGNVTSTVRFAARPTNLTSYTEGAINSAVASLRSDANNQVTRFAYDKNDRLRFTVDALGSISESVYDALGNVVRTERFAARPTNLTTYTESAINTAVASLRGDVNNQVTRFAYDADSRLRFTVDALGSISERVYDALGNVVRTVRFAARPTNLTTFTESAINGAVDRGDPNNQVTRFVYDADNRLRFTVDAVGAVSESVYNALGQVVASIRYAAKPTLTESQYTESAINGAVDRSNINNLIAHIVYDAAGRMSYSVQRVAVEGGNSKYQVTAQEFNALGQLVKATTYAAAVTLGTTIDKVAIDAALAATGIVDAGKDRTTRTVYDAAGRVVYSVQVQTTGKHQVVKMDYDALGQAVKSTTYATAVTLTSFDKATIDSAVVADTTKDRTAGFVYDAAGRVIYSVQVLTTDKHQVALQEYDALGRLFKVTQYAGEVGPLADFSKATIDTEVSATVIANHPGNRRTQYVHDAAGKQRFVLRTDNDTRWIISESRFDVHGNVIEARAYDKFLATSRVTTIDTSTSPGITEAEMATELATLGYDDADESTLANLRRTRFAYSLRNELRFTVDALGAISESTYNALGQLVGSVRYAAKPPLTAYSESAINDALDRDTDDNRVERYAYDAAGQLRFSVKVLARTALDDDGNELAGEHLVTEHNYDAMGRLVQTTSYASPVASLPDYEMQTIADSVEPSSGSGPHDRRLMIAYDAGGRQAYTVTELRSGNAAAKHIVTKRVYDALGQVLENRAYATTVTLSVFDKATIDAAVGTGNANDRTTSYLYDAAGRTRFMVAADGSFGETIYDALGQVTETRQFDIRLSAGTARTEAGLSAFRGSSAVGDGITFTRGEKYTYDAAGRRRSTTDADNKVESCTYDALGNRITCTDKTNATWTYEYDHRGQKKRDISPLVRFQLSTESTPPATDRALETHYEYDAFGNLKKKVEAANFASDARTTDFDYDTLGRLTRTSLHGYYDPDTGRVEKESTPDPQGNRFRRETAITYDVFGNAVRTSTRTGVSSFQHVYTTYNNLGQLLHELDALSFVTGYTYTAFGEQETMTRYSVAITGAPANTVHWTAAEVAGKVNSSQARTATMEYDSLGRNTKITHPSASYYRGHADTLENPPNVTPLTAAAMTTFEYTTFGEVRRQRVAREVVDANNVTWADTWHYYDAMGREARTIDPLGYQTEREYDALGNLKHAVEYATAGSAPTDPSSFTPPATPAQSTQDRITDFGYDVLNRRTSVQRFGLSYAVSSNGQVTLVTKARNEAVEVERVTYDAMGRVKTRTDAFSNVTTTDYDALGRTKQVTEPQRIRAAFNAIDPFRNQVTDSPVTTLTLDAFGNVVRQLMSPSSAMDTVAQQREILHSYDVAGNLISTADAKLGDNRGVKNFHYDYAGRMIKQTQAISVVLGFPFGGNTQTLERRFVYDAAGRQTHVLDVYHDGISGEIHLAPHRQSGKQVKYNAFGEVVEERRVWGDAGTLPASLSSAIVASYTYDDAGNRATKTAGDGLTVYFYNLAGQVTRQEQRDNDATDGVLIQRITEFGYDAGGRIVIRRLPMHAVTGHLSSAFGTPYVLQQYDRWGNVVRVFENFRLLETGGGGGGGGVFEPPGQDPAQDPTQGPIARLYSYDHDNRVSRRSYSQPISVSTQAGTQTSRHLSHEIHYDLGGRVVLERDMSSATAQGEPTELRRRRKEYNSVGQLETETDYTNIATSYAYDIYGNKVGSKNALGMVFYNLYDNSGNITERGLLRQANKVDEYNSNTGAGVAARVALNNYLYDQANRRFATTTWLEATDVNGDGDIDSAWSTSWLDERNYSIGTIHAMGVVTSCRYDEFGNKKVEYDASGVGRYWHASFADDYTVGRVLSYEVDMSPTGVVRLTTSYLYNDFGQLAAELTPSGTGGSKYYDYHANGLLRMVSINSPEGLTPPFPWSKHPIGETTYYDYDYKGQLSKERRERSYTSAPTETRTTYTNYDKLGRIETVTAPAAENTTPIGSASISSLNYSYDEFGNIRRIRGEYSTRLNSTSTSSTAVKDKWFTYDKEGRVKISNGILVNGAIELAMGGQSNSASITYDALGRRSEITEFLRSDDNATAHASSYHTWDVHRGERYKYNDLGHLKTIEQQIRLVNRVKEYNEFLTAGGSEGNLISAPVDDTDDAKPAPGPDSPAPDPSPGPEPEPQPAPEPEPQPNMSGDWNWLSTYSTNLRGDVEQHDQWTHLGAPPLHDMSVDRSAAHFSQTTTGYHADGQADYTETNYISAALGDTRTEYDYHAVTRRLESYTFENTAEDWTKTHTYTYEFWDGSQRVKRIDAGDGQRTEKFYDRLGRLTREFIDHGSEEENRFYEYDAAGHIIYKRVDKSDEDDDGELFLFYSKDGRQVAALGIGGLSQVKFDFGYTQMSEAGSSPATYAVRSGDTLTRIAQAVYGDASLWYLIADANGLSYGPEAELPTQEIGKTYSIPRVVRNTNNADTFQPYDPSRIMGSDRPAIVAPPRTCAEKHPELARVVVMAVTIVVQMVVTAVVTRYAGPVVGGAVGGAAGNLAGQTTSWALGMKEDVDFGAVVPAAAGGGISGGAGGGGGGLTTGLSLVAQEYYHQVATGFEDWKDEDGSISWSGVARSGLSSGLGVAQSQWGHRMDSGYFEWSKTVQALTISTYNEALNPKKQDFWFDAASAGVGLVAGAAAGWIEKNLRESKSAQAEERFGITDEEFERFRQDQQHVDSWIAGKRDAITSTAGEQMVKLRAALASAKVTRNRGPVDYFAAKTGGAARPFNPFLMQAPEIRIGKESISGPPDNGNDSISDAKAEGAADAMALGGPVSSDPYAAENTYVESDGTIRHVDPETGAVVSEIPGQVSVAGDDPYTSTTDEMREKAQTLGEELAMREQERQREAVRNELRQMTPRQIGTNWQDRQWDLLDLVSTRNHGLNGVQFYEVWFQLRKDLVVAAEVKLGAAVRARSGTEEAFEELRGAESMLGLALDAKGFARSIESAGRFDQFTLQEFDEGVGNIGAARRRFANAVSHGGPRLPAATARPTAGGGVGNATARLTSAESAALNRPQGMRWHRVNDDVEVLVPQRQLAPGSTAAAVAPPSVNPPRIGAANGDAAANQLVGNVGAPSPSGHIYQVGPTGPAGPYQVTRQGVLDVLYSHGHKYFRGIADAIRTGRFSMNILPTFPNDPRVRGWYRPGDTEFTIVADRFPGDVQAAGTAAHETTHYLQLQANGRSFSNYHQGDEVEAFRAQGIIDRTHWANGRSDAQLRQWVTQHYGARGVPAPPAGWTPWDWVRWR